MRPEGIVISVAGGVAVAVLAFFVSWQKWDDTFEVMDQPPAFLKFLGVRFVRGMDGRFHMTELPFHVRLALSLISALSAAIFMTVGMLYVF